MRDRDYRLNTNEPNDFEDDLDRVLNSALAIYATIEARGGLEQRILANLRADESRSHAKWWTWGLAATAVAMVVIALAWHFSLRTRPSIANHPPVPPTTVEPVAPRIPNDRRARNITPSQNRRPPKSALLGTNPKLDQFPSPRPMSDQEKILAMYINQDPEHAALIAAARMESLRQDEAQRLRIAEEDSRQIGR